MTRHRFEFADIIRQARAIERELRRALTTSDDEKIRALLDDLAPLTALLDPGDDAPLRLALVGQYNAGKSTMLQALTGRTDIAIDDDVCTQQVTSYDWEGVRILDTPGIHAGHPDHDEMTYAAMDRADLLVFVISNELFDDHVGPHFRKLAFERSKAREMMLVVNKMGQDPGNPASKSADLIKVTDPLTLEDLHAVFIDAKAVLEAMDDEDEEDREELLEIANFDDFTTALDSFVRVRGLLGRATTPLFGIRALAEQAHAYASVEFPEERAALELLNRKRSVMLESRGRLRGAMTGLLDAAINDITTLGDQVAESIEPGSSQEQVEAHHTQAQAKARARCTQLVEDGRACVQREMLLLDQQLDGLGRSILARQLEDSVQGLRAGRRPARPEDTAEPRWEPSGPRGLGEWPGQAKRIGKIASDIGAQVTQWSTGPFAAGAKIGSATAARGSSMHKVVYDVGKFFGVKFQPWGAVKVTRYIGNAGRVISAVAGVLAVVAQIAEDYQNEQQRIALREARIGVRDAYRSSAAEVRVAFTDRLEAFNDAFYQTELDAIDGSVRGLLQRRDQRTGEAGVMGELCRRASAQIRRVQTG